MTIRFFITVFMFCVLGVTLGAEALAKMGTLDACEISTESGDCLGTDHGKPTSVESPHSDHESGKCPDPCHAGQVHFGHCSFVSMSSELRLLFPEILQENGSFLKSRPDDPSLEGLRRPPRLS